MGSIAQDKKGNMALGYSVVNGVNVYPGIRYTGRLAGDPLGQMTLGEGTIINGSGVQTTTNSRWGDYTSMNVDPVDDCTFWYVNEYYTLAGQQSSAGWLADAHRVLQAARLQLGTLLSWAVRVRPCRPRSTRSSRIRTTRWSRRSSEASARPRPATDPRTARPHPSPPVP